MKKVLVIFGTRPEAIKMAPLVLALAADPRFEARVCVTAQHREMLDQVLELFGIVPDYDLDMMQPEPDARPGHRAGADRHAAGSSTASSPTRAGAGRHHHHAGRLAGGLSTASIPVGHVEAGLRTGIATAPWPEEMNRTRRDAGRRAAFRPDRDARAPTCCAEGVDPADTSTSPATP